MKPALATLFLASQLFGASCDLSQYTAAPGLTATTHGGTLEVAWAGERGELLRAGFALDGGQPVVRELAARKAGGNWIVLGRNLTPEYQVATGKRRLSEQQMAPMRELGIAFTPEVVNREQWNAFWDAPLSIPGRAGTNLGLPRKPEEIRHDPASFHSDGCTVKTDGARIEISFPGVQLGIFSGLLQYTAYKGSNLLRQEIIASTNATVSGLRIQRGLKGFTLAEISKIVWRDTARPGSNMPSEVP